MMKDKVFIGKPRTLSQMQAFIKSEFEQIYANKVLCRKICNSVLTRIEKCVVREKSRFEQF